MQAGLSARCGRVAATDALEKYEREWRRDAVVHGEPVRPPREPAQRSCLLHGSSRCALRAVSLDRLALELAS